MSLYCVLFYWHRFRRAAISTVTIDKNIIRITALCTPLACKWVSRWHASGWDGVGDELKLVQPINTNYIFSWLISVNNVDVTNLLYRISNITWRHSHTHTPKLFSSYWFRSWKSGQRHFFFLFCSSCYLSFLFISRFIELTFWLFYLYQACSTWAFTFCMQPDII